MKKMPTGYSVNECPRVGELIPLSIQQVIVAILSAIPIPLLISAALGFSTAETTILVACSLFVTGVSSLLQTIGIGPVGSRLPIFLGSSFVFITPGIALSQSYGYASFIGACLVGSIICGVICTLFYKQVAKIFQPYIAGAVVMTLGICLSSSGISMCAGGTNAEDYGSVVNYLLAVGTILIVFFLNRFAHGFLQKASPFIAMIVMTVVAAFIGKFDATPILEEPWLRLPQIFQFGVKFEAGPIITISVLSIVGIVELLGDQTTAAKFSYDRLPTDKEVRGGIMAQAVSNVFAALFNMTPNISYSSNIGVMGVTGCTSRAVIVLSSVLIMLCGISPKVCAVFSSVPSPVLGGVSIIAFGVILISGTNIIHSVKLSQRKTNIVGLSLAVGIGFSMVTDSLSAFPFWVSTLLSGIPGTAFTAVILSVIIPETKEEKEERMQLEKK